MTGKGSESEMLALLRDLEWSGRSGMEGEDASCPECGLRQGEIDYNRNSELTPSDEHGHSDKCRLSRIIHGSVSVERQAMIAVAHEKADKLHREHQGRRRDGMMIAEHEHRCSWGVEIGDRCGEKPQSGDCYCAVHREAESRLAQRVIMRDLWKMVDDFYSDRRWIPVMDEPLDFTKKTAEPVS